MIGDRDLRPRLPFVARFLIGYGIVGLLVALLALLLLVVGVARVNSLADRVRDDANGVSGVLERTAVVLDEAAASARSFGTTIDTSTTALTTAAADVRQIVPRLRDIESQAGALNILGSQPLAPIAGLFGQIAGQLDDLDSQLDAISGNLGTNRAALDANATSLTDLAAQTRTLATRFDGDALSGSLDDSRWLMIAVLVIAAAGAAVPAGGALVLGWWLRRELRAAADRSAPIPG